MMLKTEICEKEVKYEIIDKNENKRLTRKKYKKNDSSESSDKEED